MKETVENTSDLTSLSLPSAITQSLNKFNQENELWENKLLELIRIKNKETVAEVATQKTSITEDSFEEVKDLSENETEVKAAETARKSFNSLASTTGVHDSNPDTFNALPKLDVERDNISLRVVTKEIAPQLFTDPKELDPDNPAIKVIVYKNGAPVNKDLEPIAEDDYENWSQYRNVNLSLQKPCLYQLGRFRRRAYEFLYTGYQPLRLEKVEFNINGRVEPGQD